MLFRNGKLEDHSQPPSPCNNNFTTNIVDQLISLDKLIENDKDVGTTLYPTPLAESKNTALMKVNEEYENFITKYIPMR